MAHAGSRITHSEKSTLDAPVASEVSINHCKKQHYETFIDHQQPWPFPAWPGERSGVSKVTLQVRFEGVHFGGKWVSKVPVCCSPHSIPLLLQLVVDARCIWPNHVP